MLNKEMLLGGNYGKDENTQIVFEADESGTYSDFIRSANSIDYSGSYYQVNAGSPQVFNGSISIPRAGDTITITLGKRLARDWYIYLVEKDFIKHLYKCSCKTQVTSFSGGFYSCSALQSIPADLFKNCTQVTDFSYCFLSCSSLQSIPADLFKNCTQVTDFSWCFYNCSGLQGAQTVYYSSNSPNTSGNPSNVHFIRA